MTPAEKFKGMIHRGEIAIPKNSGELVTLLDRFRAAMAHDGDIDKDIEQQKEFFLNILESQCGIDSKDTPTDWAWLSNIKRRLNKSEKSRRLNIAVESFYDEDLTRLIIKQLVAEQKIKVNGSGKKIFPMSQFLETKLKQDQ